MRFVIFTHSLVSDWNHGNAHFLRGVATELVARGHEVAHLRTARRLEPHNLSRSTARRVERDFERAYPNLRSTFYEPSDARSGRSSRRRRSS